MRRAAVRVLCRQQSTPAQNPPPKEEWRATTLPGSPVPLVDHWSPQRFKLVGAVLAASSVLSFPLAHVHEVNHLVPLALSAAVAGYWYLGMKDLSQTQSTLRRNFPVLVHFRYMFESIRPEIQQYFIETDHAAEPFSRSMRSLIYQRSKGQPDTRALGTRLDVYREGYEWINHSMFPVPVSAVNKRVQIGGQACTKPYSASLLNISAMSYGALSGNAISALNLGAKRGGFYHNTGEGGLSRYHLLGGDVVWNIGTGYFACGKNRPDGSRAFDPEQFAQNSQREEVKMIEIKLSQGAKPSHGGILPAAKITPLIAEARQLGDPPYKDCDSPPRHSAFSTPKGLLQFVQQLRELSGGKPVGIKLCVGQPAEFAALCHAMLSTGIRVDFVTVDGAEGGTGAAPSEFQDSIGMPLGEGLRLVDSMLMGADLREEIRIIASGKVYNGFTLVKTIALGADLCNSARSMMFALGCIQALKCNSNNCPTGITTQKPELESALDVGNKQIRVANFHAATVHAAREIVGAAGCSDTSQISPEHIFMRHNGIHVKSYADFHSEYFPRIPRGALLREDYRQSLPAHIREWWAAGKEIFQNSDTEAKAVARMRRSSSGTFRPTTA